VRIITKSLGIPLVVVLWSACSAPKIEPEARVNRDRIETDAYIIDKMPLVQDFLPAMRQLRISETGDSLFGGRVNWITRNYVHPGKMLLDVDRGEQVFVQFYTTAGWVAAKVQLKPATCDTTITVAMDDVFEVAQEKYMLFLVIRDGIAVLKYHTFFSQVRRPKPWVPAFAGMTQVSPHDDTD